MNPEEEIIGKRRRHTNAGNELVLTFGASANFRRIYTNIRRVYANSRRFYANFVRFGANCKICFVVHNCVFACL